MHARFMPVLLALAGDMSTGMRVLDVGCGNGFTCGEFLRRHCEVVGVDLSLEKESKSPEKRIRLGALRCSGR